MAATIGFSETLGFEVVPKISASQKQSDGRKNIVSVVGTCGILRSVSTCASSSTFGFGPYFREESGEHIACPPKCSLRGLGVHNFVKNV